MMEGAQDFVNDHIYKYKERLMKRFMDEFYNEKQSVLAKFDIFDIRAIIDEVE